MGGLLIHFKTSFQKTVFVFVEDPLRKALAGAPMLTGCSESESKILCFRIQDFRWLIDWIQDFISQISDSFSRSIRANPKLPSSFQRSVHPFRVRMHEASCIFPHRPDLGRWECKKSRVNCINFLNRFA